jgi:membrane-associated phospholipid phosphatase
MNKRALILTFAICALLACLSIFVFDHRLAALIHRSVLESAVVFVRVREGLDHLTGRGLPAGEFLLGLALVTLGAIGWILRRQSFVPRAMAFTGLVQLATIAAGNMIKLGFGRLRPLQIASLHDASHLWFAGGTSFPSGHVAFFWGLFLPLVYLFPKYRIPLLLIPVFIAFDRIDENYHFLSDVLGGIALAALITFVMAILFGRWVKPSVGAMR